MDLEKLKKINYTQEKYWLPLMIYVGVLVGGYFLCKSLDFEVDNSDKSLETKYEINTDMPKAQIKGDGIGNRYDNLVNSYGKIKDETAIDSIQGDNQTSKETYESKYHDAEIASIENHSREQEEAMRKLEAMQKELQEAQSRNNQSSSMGGFGKSFDEDEELAKLQSALRSGESQIKGMVGQSQSSSAVPEVSNEEGNGTRLEKRKNTIKNPNAVTEITEETETEEVAKVTRETSSYFNTISENEEKQSLIKVIIDEESKVTENSRLRLRLLDDIEITGRVIPKGTYLYATVSGVSSQRLKGKIESILFRDELIKINLSVYDTDGMEGIYVPENAVRQTAQDVASGAFSSNMNMSTSSGNSAAMWAMQGLRNGTQRVTQAISKAIKKKKVKLKYGTLLYLINSKEKSESGNSGSSSNLNNGYYPGNVNLMK